jgi:5'-nucleotidase
MERPLILITNDDGVFASGIRVLVEEMKAFGRVLVVAPDKPQSAMGPCDHGAPLPAAGENGPRRRRGAWKCSGTPVDCVKLAIYKLLGGKKPDLLVSGVNHGSNISINVLYSGTMSAAVEGAMEGIPSVGFSLMDHSIEASFEHARPVIRSVVGNVLEHGLPAGACLNVNVPTEEKGPLKGVRICRQANANWEDDFETRVDPTAASTTGCAVVPEPRRRRRHGCEGRERGLRERGAGAVRHDRACGHRPDPSSGGMWSDRLPIGLVAGLLAPVLGFALYGLIYITAIHPSTVSAGT